MALKALWKRWDEKFSARPQRERALLAGAALVAVGFLGSALVVEPQFTRAASVRKNIESQRVESERLKLQWGELQRRLQEDPDAGLRREMDTLKSKLESINADFAKANAALVPPAEMNALLERILAKQPKLHLVSLRSLPPSGLLERKAESENKGKDDFNLYRHGVEVKLSGSYGDLYSYLVQLEGNKQKFIWGEVKFSVAEYPKAVMTIVLYTLSTEKAWLSI